PFCLIWCVLLFAALALCVLGLGVVNSANQSSPDPYHPDLAAMNSTVLLYTALFILLCLLMIGLPLLVIGGFSPRAIQKTRPGQGILASAKNALMFGAITFVIWSLFLGSLLVYLFAAGGAPLVSALLSSLSLILSLAFLVVLYYGGLACIKHIVLRSLL